MGVVRAGRNDRTWAGLARLSASRFFLSGGQGFLHILRRRKGPRTGCRGQGGLGSVASYSRNSISCGAGTDGGYKFDKLRRSFGGCEVHLEAAINLAQSGLVVEAGH